MIICYMADMYNTFPTWKETVLYVSSYFFIKAIFRLTPACLQIERILAAIYEKTTQWFRLMFL